MRKIDLGIDIQKSRELLIESIENHYDIISNNGVQLHGKVDILKLCILSDICNNLMEQNSISMKLYKEIKESNKKYNKKFIKCDHVNPPCETCKLEKTK